MKIDNDRPAVKAANDCTANGFSQDHEKSMLVAKVSAFWKAITTNRTSTRSCSPTSAY